MAVQGVTGEDPYGLFGIFPPDLAQKLQHTGLILGLEWLPAQDGDAADIIWLQIGQNLVDGLLGERSAILEVPGFPVEAVLAAAGTAGYKDADPNPGAVGDVTVFDGCVIHEHAPLFDSLIWIWVPLQDTAVLTHRR